MTDRQRVLISCQLAWDSIDEYRHLFETNALDVDIPSVRGQQLGEEDLLPIIDRYVGILAGDDVLNRNVLERASQLRVISKWGIGVDAIDQEAAKELGIRVFNTPGVFGEELADYALGFLLLLARRQHEVDRRVRDGAWYKPRGTSLEGKTLGIVGLGSSGRALARRAKVMGMKVLAYDIVTSTPPSGTDMVDLDYLLGEADVISLHLPATKDSVGIIDAHAISRMKRGAWLVNTSRGSLVDQAALTKGLASGHLGAAALDVFQIEPIPASDPLLRLSNVILGSHNGSNTHEAAERTTRAAVDNLLTGLGFRT